MTGIALADHMPVPGRWVPVFAFVAAGLGVLSWWLAGRFSTQNKPAERSVLGSGDVFVAEHGQTATGTSPLHRTSMLTGRSSAVSRWLWPVTMIGAGILAGYIALQVRSPRLDGALAAPREVVVEVAAEQLFPSSPTRKTFSGLGQIVATDSHLTELVGQRVYFSAIKRISVAPVRSGRYQLRGVLQALGAGVGTDTIAGFQHYLESAGIRLTLTRAQVIREVRPPGWFRQLCARTERRLEGILRQGIEDQPGATSLYLGMLLGEKAALSPEQQDAFMRSGTFHIFCIAGLHVGVMAAAIVATLQLFRVPRRAAIVCGLLTLWFYVQVTGANIPARRAFLMIAFLSGSRVFLLPGNSLAALVAAALLTLCLEPRELFSAGFQMSYAVVSSLVVMCAPLAHRCQEAWQPWRDLPKAAWGWHREAIVWTGHTILGALATSWVALLASTPSAIGYFGLFSPGALLANLIIVPMAMLTITAGFTSLIGGLCGLTGVSLVFNHAAAVIINTMDWLMVHGTELPGVYYRAQFLTPWLAPATLAGLVAVILAGADAGWSRRWGAMLWPPLAVTLILFFCVKFG